MMNAQNGQLDHRVKMAELRKAACGGGSIASRGRCSLPRKCLSPLYVWGGEARQGPPRFSRVISCRWSLECAV